MSSMELRKALGVMIQRLDCGRRSLRRLTEQLESLQVDRARDLGWSWPKLLANSVSPTSGPPKAWRGSRDHREEGVRDMFERFTQRRKPSSSKPRTGIELGVDTSVPDTFSTAVPRAREHRRGTVARRRHHAESIVVCFRAPRISRSRTSTQKCCERLASTSKECAQSSKNLRSGSLKSAPDRRAAATKTRRPPFTPRRNKR